MTDKIDDIYSFYDSLLRTAGLETKTDGTIWLPSKNPTQIKLSGGTLVLPLKSRLKNPAEDEMFFHPLCEQMQRYESEVFKFLKRAITVRLTSATLRLGVGLIKLQEDTALQRKLNIEQIEIIKGIADSDKNSATNWSKMMGYSMEVDKFRMDKWPIHIFMKRNGTHEGKTFRRVAVTSFPFAERIIQGEHLFGTNQKDLFRNKDYLTFTQVFMAIWPEALGETTPYNAGWNDAVAPYLSAFLRSVKKLIDRINYLCDLFAETFAELDAGVDLNDIRINYDWADLVEEEGNHEYTVMSRVIPQLKGNTGATEEDEAEDNKREASKAPRPARVEEKAPVKETAPAPTVETKAEVKPGDDPNMSEADRKLLEEARAKKAAWKAEQEEEAREDEARRARRAERQREQEEWDRQRRSERDSETPPWEDEPKKVDGKLSASDLFRGGGDRGRDRDRDDDRRRRDDRDYRRDDRDRDYRDRDYRRDDRRDSRDRDFFDRDDRDRDRDYRRDDRDRGGPWGSRRDSRDSRDYRRDDRSGPWGRRR